MAKGKVNPETGLTALDCAFIEAYNRLNKNGAAAMRDIHPDWNVGSCTTAAKRTLKKPAVVKHFIKVEADARLQSGCTLADHLNALATLRNLAIKQGKIQVAINAEVKRGEASGLYRLDIRIQHKLTPEMVEKLNLSDLTDDDLDAIRAGKVTDDFIARLTSTAREAAASG